MYRNCRYRDGRYLTGPYPSMYVDLRHNPAAVCFPDRLMGSLFARASLINREIVQ